ncbi:hypothetical protein SEVIR_6G062701v4 [Setaria viridis]
MIKGDGGIRHPLVEGSCPVLQYADDTLLLVRAELSDIRRLKRVLDSFAAATGLKINFTKSTAVPMNVSQRILPRLIRILGCKLESFPQVYLGLPLSNRKPLSAFAPLIANVDRYLARWQASLLPDGSVATAAWSEGPTGRQAEGILVDRRRESYWGSMPGCVAERLHRQGRRRTWHSAPGHTELLSPPQASSSAASPGRFSLGNLGVGHDQPGHARRRGRRGPLEGAACPSAHLPQHHSCHRREWSGYGFLGRCMGGR